MKYVFWIAVVVAVVMAGWQILEPAIANIVFQDELKPPRVGMWIYCHDARHRRRRFNE